MDVHGTTSNTSAAGLQVLRSSLGCRDLSNKGTNDKHSLEEKFWHLAFTTSTVAPLKLGRLIANGSQAVPLFEPHDSFTNSYS